MEIVTQDTDSTETRDERMVMVPVVGLLELLNATVDAIDRWSTSDDHVLDALCDDYYAWLLVNLRCLGIKYPEERDAWLAAQEGDGANEIVARLRAEPWL